MTIPYRIQIGDPLNEGQSLAIQLLIENTFSEIDQIYNDWNPDSELSRLNRLDAYQPLCLSNQLATFLRKVDQLVVQTEGRFDPTIAPLYKLWKKALQAGKTPEADQISFYATAVGWSQIHLDENNIFWKENSLTALDLGGIAKGFAVDLLVERLEEIKLTRIYVEWGGEIRTKGLHPAQRPWNIEILGHSTVALFNEAIATSGSYIQQWEVEGVTYTHLVDPRTHQILQQSPIHSVSVIAATCCEADALATALMLFASTQEAYLWAEERGLKVFIW